ncbi:hypothetical protein [Chromobacterium sinusclupearum]|nr:hypothetical protein [Chromobacterium sinusclupearum]
MLRKTTPLLLLIVLITIWILKMTHSDEKKVSKTKDSIQTGYNLFSEMDRKNFTLSQQDKKELLHFVDINIAALTSKDSASPIDKTDPNLVLELHTPKLPLQPIQRGYLTYTYIIKNKTTTANGIYGEFYSAMNRKDDESPWSYSNIEMDVSSKTTALTNFNSNDYKALNLKFVQKFTLSDIESNLIKPDLSPERDHGKFLAENARIAAFYQFSTTRNSTPLTLVFGVLKKEYDSNTEYPKNWFSLYIKRDDAPTFSLPGE